MSAPAELVPSPSLTLICVWILSATRTEKVNWRTAASKIKNLWKGRLTSYFSFWDCKSCQQEVPGLPSHNSRFLDCFPISHIIISLSKTVVIKKPNSPLPISPICLLEVISHLWLDYLLWAIADLPRAGKYLAIVEILTRVWLTRDTRCPLCQAGVHECVSA